MTDQRAEGTWTATAAAVWGPGNPMKAEKLGRAICWRMAAENWDNNARLIAAAPDLLAALQSLVAADNCNYGAETMRYEGYFAAARDAINLARTGERSTSPRPDHTTPHREFQRIFGASTCHITSQDAYYLAGEDDFPGVVHQKGDNGWWIAVTDFDEDLVQQIADTGCFSEDLYAVMKLAHDSGADWLMLDAGCPVYPDLHTNEWK